MAAPLRISNYIFYCWPETGMQKGNERKVCCSFHSSAVTSLVSLVVFLWLKVFLRPHIALDSVPSVKWMCEWFWLLLSRWDHAGPLVYKCVCETGERCVCKALWAFCRIQEVLCERSAFSSYCGIQLMNLNWQIRECRYCFAALAAAMTSIRYTVSL